MNNGYKNPDCKGCGACVRGTDPTYEEADCPQFYMSDEDWDTMEKMQEKEEEGVFPITEEDVFNDDVEYWQRRKI